MKLIFLVANCLRMKNLKKATNLPVRFVAAAGWQGDDYDGYTGAHFNLPFSSPFYHACALVYPIIFTFNRPRPLVNPEVPTFQAGLDRQFKLNLRCSQTLPRHHSNQSSWNIEKQLRYITHRIKWPESTTNFSSKIMLVYPDSKKRQTEVAKQNFSGWDVSKRCWRAFPEIGGYFIYTDLSSTLIPLVPNSTVNQHQNRTIFSAFFCIFVLKD
jgi:hypothetical protein